MMMMMYLVSGVFGGGGVGPWPHLVCLFFRCTRYMVARVTILAPLASPFARF